MSIEVKCLASFVFVLLFGILFSFGGVADWVLGANVTDYCRGGYCLGNLTVSNPYYLISAYFLGTNLLNCNTIDTDASGFFSCGVDEGGVGGSGNLSGGGTAGRLPKWYANNQLYDSTLSDGNIGCGNITGENACVDSTNTTSDINAVIYNPIINNATATNQSATQSAMLHADQTKVNRTKWTSIDNYPSDCTGDEFVKGLGDTLTCDTPIDTTGGMDYTNVTMQNQSNTMWGNNTFYQYIIGTYILGSYFNWTLATGVDVLTWNGWQLGYNYYDNKTSDFLREIEANYHDNKTSDFTREIETNYHDNKTSDFTREIEANYHDNKTSDFTREIEANYHDNKTSDFTREIEANYHDNKTTDVINVIKNTMTAASNATCYLYTNGTEYFFSVTCMNQTINAIDTRTNNSIKIHITATNDSMKAYADAKTTSANTSMELFVEAANDTMKNYADATEAYNKSSDFSRELNSTPTIAGYKIFVKPIQTPAINVTSTSPSGIITVGGQGGLLLPITAGVCTIAFGINSSATTGMCFDSDTSSVQLRRGGGISLKMPLNASYNGAIILQGNITFNRQGNGVIYTDQDGVGSTCCVGNNGVQTCFVC